MPSGIELAAGFYAGLVRPIVDRWCRDVPHAAALMGAGSEVLGHDDERSRDHDWGPRLQVFLPDDVDPSRPSELAAELDRSLPATHASRAIRFATSHDPVVRHRIVVARRADWLRDQVGFDPLGGVRVVDWLAVPTWRLAEVTGGSVFHDGDGRLGRTRAALAWYPDDVWRWALAAQWQRIAERESFPGRCQERGDVLGTGVVVAGIVRDVMRLALLLERRYPPYDKWLGTAFGELPGIAALLDHCAAAVQTTAWPARERHLGAALTALAERQNASQLAAEVEPTLRPFHDRPFLVLGAERFADALLLAIEDDQLRRSPALGVCDQFIDGIAALADRRVVLGAVGGLIRADDAAET